jgi:hypothetical protein
VIHPRATLIAAAVALMTANTADAGPYANDLAKCLAESTTAGDRAALAQQE